MMAKSGWPAWIVAPGRKLTLERMPSARRDDVSLDPVMGGLGQGGSGRTELHGRGGYRQRLVLLGGKGGLCSPCRP